jgi:repressor LexA
VHAHLANLERAGLLRRDPTKPRALELTGRGKATEAPAELPKLPLLGQIAAGAPLLADENVEEAIAVPETLQGDFLLRVKGDSMIEAGIHEGDLLVVEQQPNANVGDIVVAIVDNEFTVKYLAREKGGFVLRPANKAYPVIRPKGGLEIFGVMAGLVRRTR